MGNIIASELSDDTTTVTRNISAINTQEFQLPSNATLQPTDISENTQESQLTSTATHKSTDTSKNLQESQLISSATLEPTDTSENLQELQLTSNATLESTDMSENKQESQLSTNATTLEPTVISENTQESQLPPNATQESVDMSEDTQESTDTSENLQEFQLTSTATLESTDMSENKQESQLSTNATTLKPTVISENTQESQLPPNATQESTDMSEDTQKSQLTSNETQESTYMNKNMHKPQLSSNMSKNTQEPQNVTLTPNTTETQEHKESDQQDFEGKTIKLVEVKEEHEKSSKINFDVKTIKPGETEEEVHKESSKINSTKTHGSLINSKQKSIDEECTPKSSASAEESFNLTQVLTINKEFVRNISSNTNQSSNVANKSAGTSKESDSASLNIASDFVKNSKSSNETDILQNSTNTRASNEPVQGSANTSVTPVANTRSSNKPDYGLTNTSVTPVVTTEYSTPEANTRSSNELDLELTNKSVTPVVTTEYSTGSYSSSDITEYFKLDLEKRHEKRRQLIAEKRKEMMTLREELERYKNENEELKRGNSVDDLEIYKRENEELKRKLAEFIKYPKANYPCNDENIEVIKNASTAASYCCNENIQIIKNQNSTANYCCNNAKIELDKRELQEFINNDTKLTKQQKIRIVNELEQCKGENEKLKSELCNKTELLTQLNKHKRENQETNIQLCNITQVNEALEKQLTEVTDQLVNVTNANGNLEKQLSELTVELAQAKNKNNVLVKEKYASDLVVAKVADLKKQNGDLRVEVETLKLDIKRGEELAEKNKELRISFAQMQGELQELNAEFLNIEHERSEYAKHVGALKDVVRVTKEMLSIRESQIEELKGKVKTVEEILASKEMKIMSDGLREEYEKQLRNIRNLRNLYEERQRLDKRDKENLQEQLDECKKQVEDEQKKNSELQERVIELEKDNSLKYDSITSLQSNLGLSKAECKELQAEINIINQLFSETLLGFKNTQEIDLDKLVKMLEENHDLLTNMATNEESNSTSAALPKLLLDLINQMNKEDEAVSYENTENICQGTSNQLNSAEEIVETLPKVWKVLMELLSHQNPPLNALFGACQEEPCYKLIETSKGAKLKLSVSQTFIRLKDLILEKKFLERETYRLKHLNTHLEGRLQDQEKRLELVSSEVKSTWHVVDKMQRQHQQLHTHEKVLRYELQQKRKLLNELKEDLQYCREKWVEARAKNDTTHSQWKELRKEFADRKNKGGDDFNQSAESGYSDGKDSSEDERGYESDVSEGKHETDAETEFGKQKTESEENDEKRQLVQNQCSSSSCLNEAIKEDVTAEIVLGEEIETADNNIEENDDSHKELAQVESANTELPLNTNPNSALNELDSNVGIDSEIQELFDEMCKFVERGNESDNTNPSNVETTEEEQLARKQRLQRLEEEFKEVTEFDIKDITKDEENSANEDKLDVNTTTNCVSKDDGHCAHKGLNTKTDCVTKDDKNCANENVNIKSDCVTKDEENCAHKDVNVKTDCVTIDDVKSAHKDLKTKTDCDVTTQRTEGTEDNILKHPSDNIQLQKKEETTIDKPAGMKHESNNISDIEKQDVIKIGDATTSSDSAVEIQTKVLTGVTNRTSSSSVIKSTEEILRRRDERLKRLETQSQLLLTKTRNTTQKSNVICEKLDVLHGMYGESSNEDNSQEEARCSRKQREEILVRREARLRILEIQCKALLARVLKKSEMKNHKEREESDSKSTRKRANKEEDIRTEETNKRQDDETAQNQLEQKYTCTENDINTNTHLKNIENICNERKESNLLAQNIESVLGCNIEDDNEKEKTQNRKTALVSNTEDDNENETTQNKETAVGSNKEDDSEKETIKQNKKTVLGFNNQDDTEKETIRVSGVLYDSKEIIVDSAYKTEDTNKHKSCSIPYISYECNGSENINLLTKLDFKLNEENLVRIEERSKHLFEQTRDYRQIDEVGCLLQELIKSIEAEILTLTILYERFMKNSCDESQMLDEASAVTNLNQNLVGISEEFLDAREARFVNLCEIFVKIANEITNT